MPRRTRSLTPGTLPAVEITIDGAGDVLTQAVDPGALVPVAAADEPRHEEVPLEECGHGVGEARVGDFLVRLEVPAQAPAIEIARANRYPVIAQNDLAVQHARLVLVDAHATAQHAGVEAP